MVVEKYRTLMLDCMSVNVCVADKCVVHLWKYRRNCIQIKDDSVFYRTGVNPKKCRES